MTVWQFFHVTILGWWGGCVLVEVLLELYALKNKALHALMPEIHYRIDVFVELPLLVLVFISGALLFDASKITPLYRLKVCAGLCAVCANLYCVFVVVKRKKAADKNEQEEVDAYTRKVFASAITGIPAGLCALFLGLYFMGFIK